MITHETYCLASMIRDTFFPKPHPRGHNKYVILPVSLECLYEQVQNIKHLIPVACPENMLPRLSRKKVVFDKLVVLAVMITSVHIKVNIFVPSGLPRKQKELGNRALTFWLWKENKINQKAFKTFKTGTSFIFLFISSMQKVATKLEYCIANCSNEIKLSRNKLLYLVQNSFCNIFLYFYIININCASWS